jgi:hypothetical protein
MDHEKHWQQMLQYQPESWRDDEAWRNDDASLSRQDQSFTRHGVTRLHRSHPDVRDQTRVLELLGRINYKIISGNRVYIEVGGVVYKTLYGGYWRSVFTGIEHYLLRCEQVSGSIWAEDCSTSTAVDLPIAFSNDGWTARGHSLSFMLSRDS